MNAAKLSIIGLALGLTALGCPAPSESPSALVVGLTSEDLGGAVRVFEVVATVDGVVRRRERIDLADPAVASSGRPVFPREIRVENPRGDGVMELEVRGLNEGGRPLVTRLAKAPFVPGPDRLVRLRLEQRCTIDELRSGAFAPPVCTAPQTCAGGRCIDSALIAADLEPYVPDWASQAPDICRPANPGKPEVIVGTGQSDYAGVSPGQTLQAELGPQGGHHVWVGLRMKNLRQSGSTTTITGRQPDTGAEVPPTAFVFTFDQDEGGFCKLYGLRYQLDNGAANLREDYKRFLGKDLDVTVEVRDSTGASAKGTTRIRLADKVLCPDGTSGTCM